MRARARRRARPRSRTALAGVLGHGDAMSTRSRSGGSRAASLGRGGHLVDDLVERLRSVIPGKSGPSSERAVGDDAERIQVGDVANLAPRRLLGRHVRGGTDDLVPSSASPRCPSAWRRRSPGSSRCDAATPLSPRPGPSERAAPTAGAASRTSLRKMFLGLRSRRIPARRAASRPRPMSRTSCTTLATRESSVAPEVIGEVLAREPLHGEVREGGLCPSDLPVRSPRAASRARRPSWPPG